jgi:hypothetical protein
MYQEAADMFTPRSIAPPNFDGTAAANAGARDELPPDYTTFAPGPRMAVRAR